MQLINKNNIKYNELFEFLKEIDNSFAPKLSEQTELSNYTKKLIENGFIITTKKNSKIIGLIAGYINNKLTREAYISLVYVDKEYRRQNIATNLMQKFIEKVNEEGYIKISLECNKNNLNALSFYKNFDFKIIETTN